MSSKFSSIIISLILFLFSLYFHVSLAGNQVHKQNPFTVKSSLIRYWKTHISNNHSIPPFLLSKASPLSAVNAAVFSKLAAEGSLSTRLPAFCSAAHLFCSFSPVADTAAVAVGGSGGLGADFATYSNKKFSGYGGGRRHGSRDSFKNYSQGVNMPVNGFTRYGSPGSTGHVESFANYADDGNVANDSFTSYGPGGAGGGGEFTSYQSNVNVVDLKFTTYSSNGNNHRLGFGSYAEETNSGSQVFTTYGKNGNSVPTEFTNYAPGGNIVASSFSSYGELGNAANDSFKGYAIQGNNPHNNFKNYGSRGSSRVERFENYRDQANVGDDTFQSYGRGSSSGRVNFLNYGKSFNVGLDAFKEYGKGAVNRNIGFKGYGVNNSFKGYGNGKKGISFAGYSSGISSQKSGGRISKKGGEKVVVNNLVEEGKFFREGMLKKGTVFKMPDIKDKMPPRSFLPRTISSKLPFSTARLADMRGVFRAQENSTLERVMRNALAECERAPSPGETKRCVASVEDMVDFAVEVLGHNVVVRTTENVNGSGQRVVIGSVQGVNGGRVTKSVSCHQSLFPYLLYYCHSVPKVKVYEADILDLKTKAKINHGVAICHIDTSAWSPGHGAFLALGSGPGLIEVCHWIFENDMTWATADH